MWGLNSQPGIGTLTPCIERQSLNHWISRKSLFVYYKNKKIRNNLNVYQQSNDYDKLCPLPYVWHTV